jgi:hypothetical protein
MVTSHKTDTGNQLRILLKELLDYLMSKCFPFIILKMLAMTINALVFTTGEVDSKGNFIRDLLEYNIKVVIL